MLTFVRYQLQQWIANIASLYWVSFGERVKFKFKTGNRKIIKLVRTAK